MYTHYGKNRLITLLLRELNEEVHLASVQVKLQLTGGFNQAQGHEMHSVYICCCLWLSSFQLQHRLKGQDLLTLFSL